MYIRKTDWPKDKVWPKDRSLSPDARIVVHRRIRNAPRYYRFAFSCWVRNNSRKQNNNTPLPPKTVPIFGAALNAVDR